mmetsp:Transcript_30051/g.77522  ORF Transcript_30051/g.77522 Transcript_30051/m.77522 type:complete len:275 (+) Transcript_30051:1071-1895(+)
MRPSSSFKLVPQKWYCNVFCPTWVPTRPSSPLPCAIAAAPAGCTWVTAERNETASLSSSPSLSLALAVLFAGFFPFSAFFAFAALYFSALLSSPFLFLLTPFLLLVSTAAEPPSPILALALVALTSDRLLSSLPILFDSEERGKSSSSSLTWAALVPFMPALPAWALCDCAFSFSLFVARLAAAFFLAAPLSPPSPLPTFVFTCSSTPAVTRELFGTFTEIFLSLPPLMWWRGRSSSLLSQFSPCFNFDDEDCLDAPFFFLSEASAFSSTAFRF